MAVIMRSYPFRRRPVLQRYAGPVLFGVCQSESENHLHRPLFVRRNQHASSRQRLHDLWNT